MLPTDVIEDYNALPPEAQKQVIDFVAFMKSRYHSIKIDILESEEKEKAFGILSARKSVTVEEMDKAIQ
jgi:hypothetical protein